MLILNKLLLTIILLSVFGLFFGNLSKVQAATFEEQVIEQINSERQKAGLSQLNISDKLTQAAQTHNQLMADCAKTKGVEDCFKHQISGEAELMDRIKATGYNSQSVAENIAWGYQTAASMVDGWMNSSGHKENILGNYKDIGCDYVDSMDGSYQDIYWTCDFGKSFSATPTNKPTSTSTPTTKIIATKIPTPTKKLTPTKSPTSTIKPTHTPTTKIVTKTPTPTPKLSSRPWWCVLVPSHPTCK